MNKPIVKYVVSRFGCVREEQEYYEICTSKAQALKAFDFLSQQDVVGTCKVVMLKEGQSDKVIKYSKKTLGNLINCNRLIFSETMELWMAIYHPDYEKFNYHIHSDGITLIKNGQLSNIGYKKVFADIERLRAWTEDGK